MKQNFLKPSPKIMTKKYSKYIYPYLEVWHEGKRSRFFLGCKVMATQWCKDKNRAYISSLLSALDNSNNSIANNKIEASIARYAEFINYLCADPQKLNFFHSEFKAYMGRPRKQQTQQPQLLDVFETIERATINNKQLNDKTGRNNYIGKGLKALKAFSEWREVPINNFDMITADLIYEFAEFMNSGRYTNKGEPYAMSSINSIIKYAVSAIKQAPTAYLSKERAQTLPTPQLTDKTSQDNHIGLRDCEIIKLWQYTPTSKEDEEIRDMFLLLCLTGQRVNDLTKFQGGYIEENGIPCLKLVQEKCSHKLSNDIVFPLAVEILEKYSELPISNIEKKINKNISRIAKNAGISGTEQVSIHYQGNDKPTEFECERADLIFSHTGRRSFVSILSVHGWNYERIGKYTGQSAKIVALYDKSTSIDKRIFENSHPDERLEVFGDTPKTVLPQPQQPNRPLLKSLPNSIDEAKRVLNYLGVDTDDYIEIDNLDTLLRLIAMREGEIIKGLNLERIEQIKEIFNQQAPIKERKVHLHNLITMWECETNISLF